MKNPNPAPENTADKLIVRGVHLALTPALRDYVADKSARLKQGSCLKSVIPARAIR